MANIYRSQRAPSPQESSFGGAEYSETLQLRDHMDSVAEQMLIDQPSGLAPSYPHSAAIDADSVRPEFEELLADIETTSKEASGYISQTDDSGIPDSDYSLPNVAKPFNRQLRYLSSRFIVQTLLGADKSGSEETNADAECWHSVVNNARDLVKTVPRIARQTGMTDALAYEVAYREFDRLRLENKHGIVEAYMGRDGIFAYFGRLGQLAARGDNEPAVAAYPADESRMARPTVRYVVYSREVAFGSDANLKYRYLLQFVNPGEEIHCFDTGYRGSVPKDVLKIMGTPLTQIGDHIHLLQCNSFMGKVKRQIKGLPKNLSINTIEGYDQDEQSATGLVETEGAIKYRARLSEPSEQFKFLARRHMLYSYFLNSERHKISSGQVRRGIRIP